MPPPPTRRQVLALAWPIVLANLGVPLLGLVDTAVIGNTGAEADIGAIGLGALIFAFVFWGFGFLRMGTTGFVAQAAGRNDSAEVRATAARGLMLAAGLGVGIVLLQEPIAWLAFQLITATPHVEQIARGYYDIRIWCAPASLGLFTVLGALIGLGATRQVLLVQVVLNGLNIVLDVALAGVMGMGVTGIAIGTVVAEWSAASVAVWLLVRVLRRTRQDTEPWWPTARIMDRSKALGMLGANLDILVRTVFLLFGFAWFTNQGARFGDTILAANFVLMQLISLSAYLLDGYANATEILVGRTIGGASCHREQDEGGERGLVTIPSAPPPHSGGGAAGACPAPRRGGGVRGDNTRDNLKAVIRPSTELAAITAVVFAVLAMVLGSAAIQLITDLEQVRDMAGTFLPYTALYIMLSFAAFQLDGIAIGATATGAMRNASIVSTLAFVGVSLLLIPPLGNHGLWISMILFVVVRAVALFPALERIESGGVSSRDTMS